MRARGDSIGSSLHPSAVCALIGLVSCALPLLLEIKQVLIRLTERPPLDHLRAPCLPPLNLQQVWRASWSVILWLEMLTPTHSSVILNPRQTSIWSCALAADFLALGCDDAILLSHDPTSRKMRTLQTGSAVLALDAHEVRTTLALSLTSGLLAFRVRLFTAFALVSSRSRT